MIKLNQALKPANQSLYNIKETLLLPNNEEHFQNFKRIITDQKVVFNSCLIANHFDLTILNHYCDNFETKLKLKLEDDVDIVIPDEVVNEYLSGKSTAVQLALNRFFSFENNLKTLRELYCKITSKAEETGLGYYKFEDISEDSQDDLLGGGALISIVEDGKKIKKADFILHIIRQNQGIGSQCFKKLITKAFEEKSLEEIWCKSTKQDLKTINFMCKRGMIIRDEEKGGWHIYYMNRRIRKATKNELDEVTKRVIF